MHGHSPPPDTIGESRVPVVRRELTDGRYDLDGRLDVVLDKLLEDFMEDSGSRQMAGNTESGSEKQRTKILIVGGHAVVRRGLARLIEAEPDLTVCAEAETAAQALEAAERQEFDLAIVDVSLRDAKGLELTDRMKSRHPRMTILVLSVYDGLLYARRALQAGAAGYVAKHEAPERIIAAIRQVLAGKVYISTSSTSGQTAESASVIGNGHHSRGSN